MISHHLPCVYASVHGWRQQLLLSIHPVDEKLRYITFQCNSFLTHVQKTKLKKQIRVLFFSDFYQFIGHKHTMKLNNQLLKVEVTLKKEAETLTRCTF